LIQIVARSLASCERGIRVERVFRRTFGGSVFGSLVFDFGILSLTVGSDVYQREDSSMRGKERVREVRLALLAAISLPLSLPLPAEPLTSSRRLGQLCALVCDVERERVSAGKGERERSQRTMIHPSCFLLGYREDEGDQREIEAELGELRTIVESDEVRQRGNKRRPDELRQTFLEPLPLPPPRLTEFLYHD
jgi:hypothetical protein